MPDPRPTLMRMVMLDAMAALRGLSKSDINLEAYVEVPISQEVWNRFYPPLVHHIDEDEPVIVRYRYDRSNPNSLWRFISWEVIRYETTVFRTSGQDPMEVRTVVIVTKPCIEPFGASANVEVL